MSTTVDTSKTGIGGGGGAWGGITGSLPDQTDLSTALDGKEDAGAAAAAVAAVVGGAGPALDTLKELADSINDDANFAATVTTALSGKVPTTRTVNGHALSADVTVTAADVGAPSGSGTSTGSNSGDQDLSGYQTIANLAADVRSTALTGLSTAAGTVVTATHTVLQAIGFLQKQASDNTTAITGKQTTLVSGTNIKTINSTSLLGSGDIAISASPGGSSGQPQGNISGAFAAIPNWTFDTTSGVQTFGYGTTANTSVDGLAIASATAATSGNQQYSPRLRLKGFGWRTNSTAASQAVEFITEVQPVQGAAAPTANLLFSYAVAGGSFSPLHWLQSDGLVVTNKNGAHAFTVNVSGHNPVGFGRNGSVTGFQIFDETQATPNDFNAAALFGGGKVILPSTTPVGWTASSINQNLDTALSRVSAGIVGVGTGAAGNIAAAIKLQGVWFGSTFTVGTLPTASASEGLIYRVSDSNVPVVGSTVASGGSTKCTVQSDATNWKVIWIA
jgi:hypothetical protein